MCAGGAERPLGNIAAGSSQMVVLPEQLGWPAARSPWCTEFSWEGGCWEQLTLGLLLPGVPVHTFTHRWEAEHCRHKVGQLVGTSASATAGRNHCLYRLRKLSWQSRKIASDLFDNFGFVRRQNLLRLTYLIFELKYMMGLLKSECWALQYNL